MSKIEWTRRKGLVSRVWNFVTGCNKVSRGCKFCYAEVMHKRLMGIVPSKYSQPFNAGSVFHKDVLLQAHSWKHPSLVFVNSMSDLFHNDITDDQLLEAFKTMWHLSQHTFIILTKRSERLPGFYQYLKEYAAAAATAPNIWLLVSTENQATANQRIPHLLATTAAIKGISAEPLLSHINLPVEWLSQLHWVIAGGESGPKASPMHPTWPLNLQQQCQAAGVPFFFKQWGQYRPFINPLKMEYYIDACTIDEYNMHQMNFIEGKAYPGQPGRFIGHRWRDAYCTMIENKENGDTPCQFLNMGKKHSGHLLYGIQFHQWPTINSPFSTIN